MPRLEDNNFKILKYAICIVVLLINFMIIVIFNRFEEILYSPPTTPNEWLAMQPYLELTIFSTTVIFIQPTSTFFVYFLGLITIVLGFSIIRTRNGHKSRLWWGIALLLWGAGALFAGTSYQAFSYELKCAGRAFCLWTSWWEVIYLIFSAGSVNAMMMAQAHSCATDKWRRVMSAYAFVNMVLYIFLTLIGTLIPIEFLISFELMLTFFAPNILLFFVMNSWRYYQNNNKMDFALLGIWISLIIILALYYLYLVMGITETLWEHGIWFSENDILHIGLIAWMIYIYFIVTRHIKDTIRSSSL